MPQSIFSPSRQRKRIKRQLSSSIEREEEVAMAHKKIDRDSVGEKEERYSTREREREKVCS